MLLGAATLAPATLSLAQEARQTDYDLVCVEDGVRIRHKPRLNGQVRGTVNTGDRVRVTGVSVEADGHTWVPVTVVGTNTNGWASVAYFERVDGEDIGWLPGTVVHVNSTRVNLHAGPGINYETVGNFNTGTQGVVNDGPSFADGYSWYNVTLDNVTGWMTEDYLTEGPYSGPISSSSTESLATVASWRVVAASDAPHAVKDSADFICDGVDDHTQLQEAIDSLAGAVNGGGTVWLSTGTFYVGATITQSSRISVKGLGGYNTLGSPDGGTTIRRQSNFASGSLWAFEVAWWGAELAWVTFDGNKNNIAGGDAPNVRLEFSAEGSDIHHVLSVNAPGDGFVVEGESTPANLRQCSAFANNGWGFNLANVTRMVTLWNPSGDSNGAGLIRVNGPNTGAISSVVIHSPKGERMFDDSGNDPAIHIDDYVGPVTIIGGSLDGNGSTTKGSIAIRRSGTHFGVLNILGLRASGYADYILHDTTSEGASIVDEGNGWTTTVNGCTTPSGFHVFGTGGSSPTVRSFSAPWTSRDTSPGWYSETWVPAPGISQDHFIRVSFARHVGGGWQVEAEPYLHSGTWYVLVRLWNLTGSMARPEPGTVYVRAEPR